MTAHIGAARSAASFDSFEVSVPGNTQKATVDPIADEAGGEIVSTAFTADTWSPMRQANS